MAPRRLGVFDLIRNWSRPHCSHRDGRSVDIRTHGAAGVSRADSIIIVRFSRFLFWEPQMSYVKEVCRTFM